MTTPLNSFEIICRHKDTNPSNLNKLFASYGTETLEAKCPIIDELLVNQLENGSDEQKRCASLMLKSEAASRALEGRVPRTRNKVLKLIEINGETMLVTAGDRDRSPVDKSELDKDLDDYMKEAGKRKLARTGDTEAEESDNMSLISFDGFRATAQAMLEPKLESDAGSKSANTFRFTSRLMSDNQLPTRQQSKNSRKDDENIDEDDLDADLDKYMREASRRRTQKRVLDAHTNQMTVMELMERNDTPVMDLDDE